MKNLLDLVNSTVGQAPLGLQPGTRKSPLAGLRRLFGGRSQQEQPGQASPDARDAGLGQISEEAGLSPQVGSPQGGEALGGADAKVAQQEEAQDLAQKTEVKAPEVQDDKAAALPSPDSATDPETKLGLLLAQLFPRGVAVGVYDAHISNGNDREFGNMARQWAKSENAVGAAGNIAAGTLATGLPVPITQAGSIAAPVNAIHRTLTYLADKVATFAPEAPRSGAVQIQRLGIFTHGYTTGMRSRGAQNDKGQGVKNTRANAADFIGQISGALTGDVRVALYACTTGRGASEKDSWTDTTLNDGGSDGYASAVRDGLIEHGHDQANVGAHTTSGHTTRNFALREFSAADGKGANGASFATRYIWDWKQGPADIIAHLKSQGYALTPTQEGQVSTRALPRIKTEFYRGYNRAMTGQKTSDGRDLQELAMLEPLTVQSIVKPIWDAKWSTLKTQFANEAATAFRLRKEQAQPAPQAG